MLPDALLRRNVLGGSFALAAAITGSAIAPAVGAENHDAALLAFTSEWEATVARELAARATIAGPGLNDDEVFAAFHRACDDTEALTSRIINVPACTLEGIVFKARVMLWRRYDDVAALERAVLNDVQQFEGESQDDNALLLDILRVGNITHAGGSAVQS